MDWCRYLAIEHFHKFYAGDIFDHPEVDQEKQKQSIGLEKKSTDIP